MNDEEYKEYIYDNIKSNMNHYHIINMIKEQKCNYTENKNGFFINLNDINSSTLKNIYEILKTQDKKNNMNHKNDTIINDIKTKLHQQDKIRKQKVIPEQKNIYLNELSTHEKDIILFIKQI